MRTADTPRRVAPAGEPDVPAMLPHDAKRETTLVANSQAVGAVVYPSAQPDYRRLAERIAQTVREATGVSLPTIPDTDIVPRRGIAVPSIWRSRPLVVLGSINDNHLVLPLYARFLCATDCTYPGADGYELRTCLHPYAQDTNWILAGGSTLPGVDRAVERLCSYIRQAGKGADLELPWLLDLHLEPSLEQPLREWPQTPLNAPVPTNPSDLLVAIGPYAAMYGWTGDERYALYARDCLRALNASRERSYGDWHYLIERLVYAMPWLVAGGFLGTDEVLRTEQMLLATAIETEGMWWRMKNGQPPLGHRHHGKGTFAFYLQCRYLLTQASPNPAAAALLTKWLDECSAYLDALAEAYGDDQEDESTFHNLGTLVWYALGQERYAYFESGNARLCAEKAIALHDNRGTGAGTEGYAESLSGALYQTLETGPTLSAAAFYYRDGELKSVLEQVSRLRTSPSWTLSPPFMHRFDAGATLEAQTPASFTGMRRLRLSEYQWTIRTRPPERTQPLGHATNAPETWLRQGGVGINELPITQAFDKIVFRNDFSPTGPYLLLQGMQSAWRWQGAMQAANAIVRFSQGGHAFLVQNTDRQSYHDKNAVLVSDGHNDGAIPPLAECVATVGCERSAISVTRLSGYHGTDWTRNVFWSRPGDGFFVVLDAIAARRPGDYSLTCSWRTPAHAELVAQRWEVRQGQHVFTLHTARPLPAENEQVGPQGACSPYILRQRQRGALAAGDVLTFENLFYVHPASTAAQLELRYLAPGVTMVTDSTGAPQAWCAVSIDGSPLRLGALSLQATAAMVSEGNLAAAGLRELKLCGDDGLLVQCDVPAAVSLDFGSHLMTIGAHDTPVHATILCGAYTRELSVAAHCQDQLALDCVQWPTPLAAQPTSTPPGAAVSQGQPLPSWPARWERDIWTPQHGRLRDFTVTAEPEPLDAFTEQLSDAVVSEFRSRAPQFPPAGEYQFLLEFAREHDLASLRLIGDSQVQPFAPEYSPLDVTVSASLSLDAFATDARQCEGGQRTEEVALPRWIGTDDRHSALRLDVADRARQVRLKIRPTTDKPLILQEIEAFASKTVAPKTAWLHAADIDGDGRREALAISATGEVVVVDRDGTLRWRYQAPARITCHRCLDIDGTGRERLCLGVSGNTLIVLDHDGSVYRRWAYAERLQSIDDLYYGSLRSINGIGIWRREADARACLAIGGYAATFFTDADGAIIGHSWGDGSWQEALLAVPPEGPEPWDLWVRNRWNHGISVYEGAAGLAPSGHGLAFGGLRQPMFRALARVIPFTTGRTVAFEWLGSPDGGSPLVLLACEHGVGVLGATSRDWVWQVLGGAPISDCVAIDDEVVIGGPDCFVASFALRDGRPRRKRLLGTPVHGICAAHRKEGLVVVTAHEIALLDERWASVRALPVSGARLCDLGEGDYVAATADGRLLLLSM